MKQTVTVTQEDINQGFPENCVRCPVALAITRTWPGRLLMIDVSAFMAITWPEGTLAYSARLPKAAINFITHFDAHDPVRPFAFDLDWLPAATAVLA